MLRFFEDNTQAQTTTMLEQQRKPIRTSKKEARREHMQSQTGRRLQGEGPMVQQSGGRTTFSYMCGQARRRPSVYTQIHGGCQLYEAVAVQLASNHLR